MLELDKQRCVEGGFIMTRLIGSPESEEEIMRLH